jgi:mRNA-degrading endonuclease toxin of MazEF toxin-antitoxin module
MNIKRGDVALARLPHAAGGRGKKRPVVIVQADTYNQHLRHAIVAEITTNLTVATDPSSLLIVISTPEGKATGLKQDSVVTCLHLVTMSEGRIGKVIGSLSATLLRQLDNCLKAALGIVNPVPPAPPQVQP